MKYNFDIAFLGGLFPPEKLQEILNNSIGIVQNAANVLQWNFVNGMDQINETPVKIINLLFIGSYPKRYKKLFIDTYKFEHCKGADDINVGFINLTGLKQILSFWFLKPRLKKWALNKCDNKVVIGYALTAISAKGLNYIKKINPNITTCMIVPDLPAYMDTSETKSFLYKVMKKIEWRSIKRNLPNVDSYVMLTKHMAEYLKINKPVAVIEGISLDKFKNICRNQSHQGINTILYTGTLYKRYGVMKLIEAFQNIPFDNYRLILAGSGDSEDQINEAAAQDNRIIYLGTISHDDVLRLQLEATVLVNPRQNNEEFTKFSFPSKIMEYLSSGVPVIAYKLDGIPDEYDDYLFYVPDDNVESLTNKIIEVCCMDKQELEKKGCIGREFVLKEKNRVVQAEKILSLLEKAKRK